MVSLLRNPLLVDLRWWGVAMKLQRSHVGLRMGHRAVVHNTTLGQHNSIDDGATIMSSTLGDYSYLASHASVNNATIGRFCSIGSGAHVSLGVHPTGFVSTHPAFYSKDSRATPSFATSDHAAESEPITIGHDVWIGANALIMDGITIGTGAIVAAGAVVTKDVAPYSIVGGVPAKPIGERFDKSTATKLLASEWWARDLAWIQTNHERFLNVDTFLALES